MSSGNTERRKSYWSLEHTSWKINLAGAGAFFLALAIILSVVGYLEITSTKSSLRKDVKLWTIDLTEALTRGDGGLIEKVSRGIFVPQLKWIEVKDRQGLAYSFPNILDGGTCFFSETISLVHYGVKMGTVTGCIEISAVAKATLLSPIVFLVAILLILIAKLASFLSIDDYRTSVLRTLHILGDWSRNGEREIGEVLPAGISNNKDPVTAKMLDLVRDGVILRLEDQRAQDELEAARSLAALSSQVAHDIRSPLAALEVVSNQLDRFPEETRTMVRSAIGRIRDIANHLLEKYRRSGEAMSSFSSHSLDASGKEEPKSQWLYGLIDSLLTEKRIQFRSRGEIDIVMNISPESYHLSARVEPIEFMRVLSNLVENAVEAIAKRGVVHVVLKSDSQFLYIEVIDNGAGIPSDILSQLGQRGVTFAKPNGTGCGLSHAFRSVRAWSGKLNIESIIGQGTTVTIQLPKAPLPQWCAESLSITKQSSIVVLDDDRSIHELWDTRFRTLPAECSVSVSHFSDYDGLASWKSANNSRKDTIFLVDYELLGSQMNGLDVIVSLGIESRSLLVTSRYEDASIVARCETIGVKLIPKSMAGFIKIQVEDAKQPEAILIEDNPIIHMAWESCAKEENLILHAFENATDFFSESHRFNVSTPVYIDCALGDGQPRGEWVAEEIHRLGFENIYLATGYSENDIEVAPWIKGVVGKTPPWK